MDRRGNVRFVLCTPYSEWELAQKFAEREIYIIQGNPDGCGYGTFSGNALGDVQRHRPFKACVCLSSHRDRSVPCEKIAYLGRILGIFADECTPGYALEDGVKPDIQKNRVQRELPIARGYLKRSGRGNCPLRNLCFYQTGFYDISLSEKRVCFSGLYRISGPFLSGLCGAHGTVHIYFLLYRGKDETACMRSSRLLIRISCPVNCTVMKKKRERNLIHCKWFNILETKFSQNRNKSMVSSQYKNEKGLKS